MGDEFHTDLGDEPTCLFLPWFRGYGFKPFFLRGP